MLEKAEPHSGATGNNAGFLITGFGEHFSKTVRNWGLERAIEIQKTHIASHRMIRELTNTVVDCGSYTIPVTEKERTDLRNSYELMRENGFPVEWLESAPVSLRGPAIFNPQDGLMDSKRFWMELAAGLPCNKNSEVLNVLDAGNSFRIQTKSQEFSARRIVYCLNAFSGDLLPELKRRIIPLRGQMLEVELISRPPCFQPVIAEYGEVYWNFTEKTLRFGGLEYLCPEEEVGIAAFPSAEVTGVQLSWIRKNLEIEFGKVLKTWCGTMGFTVDGFPFVGELPGRPNQYVLAGMCGLGHSYAMVGASWLFERIAHDKAAIPAYFSSDRIIILPEYSGGNWRSLYEAWNH